MKMLFIVNFLSQAKKGELGGGKAISGSNPLACHFLDEQEIKESFESEQGSFEEESRTTVKCPEGYLHTADKTTCFKDEEDWAEEEDLPTYRRHTKLKKPSAIVSVSGSMLKDILSDGVLLVIQDVILVENV